MIIDNSKYMHSFSGPECYVGMGHINQTRLGANGQKALEMTVYTMAQEEGENRPSALKINGCGLYKGSYFDRVRPKKLTYSLQVGSQVIKFNFWTKLFHFANFSVKLIGAKAFYLMQQSPKTNTFLVLVGFLAII